MDKRLNRGFAVILSAPSGTGKTSIARQVMTRWSEIQFSVSTTTRKPRPGEQEGVDYCFVDSALFKEKIEAGDFLEWALVFDNYYGTDQKKVSALIEAGKIVLLDIDWQGAQQIRKKMPQNDVISVFVMPPSPEALANRLQGRGTDSAEVIAKRMEKSTAEMAHWREYDYLLINEHFEAACQAFWSILEAESLKRVRVKEKEAILRRFSLI
ncbi:guanylate kinase [Magnetococcales bacterium HHB-1]